MFADFSDQPLVSSVDVTLGPGPEVAVAVLVGGMEVLVAVHVGVEVGPIGVNVRVGEAVKVAVGVEVGPLEP